MRYFKILFSSVALLAASCIHNDIPLPVVTLNILSIEGEGFTSSIDAVSRTVTLTLDERTDIENVRIDNVTLTDQAEASQSLTGVFDLRAPLYVTLSLYQDYEWTIRAVQPIERAFAVVGQIGATEWDIEKRIATAYIAKTADLTSVEVTKLKLGPADITAYSPTLEDLSGSSFETVRFVDITAHKRTERWLLYVLQTDISVALTQADAWSRVIWLYGAGTEGRPMGFRYRKQGEENWNEAPGVTVTGGSFTARVTVEAETTYEVKAYCGDDESASQTLTTEGVMQLPNNNFETWSKPKNPWLPFASDDSGNPINPFWATSNNGSTVISSKDNLVTPVEDLHPGATGRYCAQLESRYVVIKLAAGSLFAGEFAGLRNMSHGIVNFGRPFTLRPTALRVWVKYNCGIIDNDRDIGSQPIGSNIQVGDYDTGNIYVALGTWTKDKYGWGKGKEELFGSDASPVSIDTRDVGTFFNPQGPDVVAYGAYPLTESIAEWRQITIPINYRSTNERPTHIIVVCASSSLGDYFTGSRHSRLSVDDIELVYE